MNNCRTHQNRQYCYEENSDRWSEFRFCFRRGQNEHTLGWTVLFHRSTFKNLVIYRKPERINLIILHSTLMWYLKRIVHSVQFISDDEEIIIPFISSVATDHIYLVTTDKFFTKWIVLKSSIVKVENGNPLEAKEKRSMDSNLINGRICTMNNVLYVFEMKNSLVRTAVKLKVHSKDS